MNRFGEITIHINGTPVLARIDLELTRSFINRDLLPHLLANRSLICYLDPPRKTHQLLGDYLAHNAIASVYISLQSMFLPFNFTVVNMTTPVILGLDFFTHYQLDIDTSTGHFTVSPRHH